MEQMKQMYTEAIDLANRLSAQDVRFRTYLDFALERMEMGLEFNVERFFREGASDLASASFVLHYNTFNKRVEA